MDSRRKCVFGVMTLACALLLPSLVLLARTRDHHGGLIVLGQSALLLGLAMLAAGRWRRVWWLALPFLFLVPIEVGFIALYGYPSTRHALALVAETSGAEAMEFLSGLWLPLTLSLAATLALAVALYRGIPPSGSVQKRTRTGALLVLALLLIAPEVGRRMPDAPLAWKQFSWADTFPLGVPFRAAGYWRHQHADAQASEAIGQHRWNARSNAPTMDVVLVIGESARPDHWQINGYGRPTNPALSQVANIAFMPDLVTPWTLTRYATPLLITRKDARNSSVFPERSIVSAFREAGYATHWLANQDGIEELGLHAGEAQFRKRFNLAVAAGDSAAAYDSEMLPSIAQALSSQGKLRFLVIHMKGSHWDYHLRYPQAESFFQPDRRPGGEAGKYDRRNRDLLVNAYDNSLRHTDAFLGQLIQMLSKPERPAALVYVSDHGQALYDGDCATFGHGNELETAYRTAGLVWTSPAWVEANAAASAALKRNSARPLLTANTIFHTLADFGGLNIADTRYSLLSASLQQQVRWVNTAAGAVDFDRSQRLGMCKAVAALPNLR